MKDLLLIFASPRDKGAYVNVLPPAGILYLAAYLEERGFSVDIVDCNVEKFFTKNAGNYKTIGFSINIANAENSVALINEISTCELGIKLIVGGPLPTVAPEAFFSLAIKAIFVSESEESLHEYLRQPDSENNKGYYFRDKAGGWHYNGPHAFLSDLDKVPFPSLDKIDLKKYYTPVKKCSPVSILISSRGCPFNCAFCCNILGRTYRARSAMHVVSEIEWQVRKFGVKEIAIYDDNFTLDNQRVRDICSLLSQRGVKVSLQLTNGVRADTLSLDLLRDMKQAGFWMIAFAPESGNRQTLEKINKKLELSSIEQCLSWCRKLGIRTWAFFMVGFPWEDAGMFKNTVDFAAAIDADIVHFSNFVSLPGTALFEQAGEKSGIWPLSDLGFFVEDRLARLRPEGHGRTARAYRDVYFKNPERMLRLFRVFSVPDLVRLVWYALKSGNIY